MNRIQRLWQKVSPELLLVFIRYVLEPRSYKKRRKAVLEHFKNADQNSLAPEIREGLEYLRYHKYTPFPFKWTQRYDRLLPDVYRDEANSSYYTFFDGRKMYFPRTFTLTHVIWNMRTIMKEQDPCSPHQYLNADFQVEPGSIVIDAGVAEGNFALSVVESAKRLYLVECDMGWMEALKLTFAPWKEKVVFVEKYLADIQSEKTTSIDSLIGPAPEEHYFIKLDIEGFEQKALSGMKLMVRSGNPIKMNVCTYHRPNDLTEIETILWSYGFTYKVSKGYVLYFQEGEEPSFRKALIRAEKK
jgi:hypothetical protein